MPASTVVQSGTCTTYFGTISSTYSQYARDYLAGYSGEYYFFRYDENEYVLLLFDDYDLITSSVGWSVSVESPEVVVFDRVQQADGYQTYTAYRQTSASYEGSFTVNNSSGIVSYASFDDFPHLIEGSVYYDYAQTALICSVIVFCLIDRIFKHIR